MSTTIYTRGQLDARYDNITHRVHARCELQTELVGGMSADRAGVEAFVAHHLHLEGDEATQAVERILHEEVGERNVTPEGGEVPEKLTYGICIIRRDEAGPWVGDWMVKACLKAAASRLGLFVAKRGVKGDMAELGRVRAVGVSLAAPDHPERIHLVDVEGRPAMTCFKEFKGRVNQPTGAVSIVSDRECVAEGHRFEFEFRCYAGKLTADDLANIFAAAQTVGLGSAKAFERGKFSIERLEVEVR